MLTERSITVGVHLIVKNEADRLPRCLDAVSEWASQIVVVDTGSTDRTREIAEAFRVEVIAHVWRDDFSAARNAGLEHAATDWVLVLDADEEVFAGGSELHAFLQTTENDRCLVVMEHLLGARPEEALMSQAVRLFRADKGYRYEGRVHEQLVPGGTRPGGAKPESTLPSVSPLRIVHYGYLPGELSRKGTAERNLRLLEREASEKPEDAFTLFNLGVTFCQLGKLDQAVRAFDSALNTVDRAAPYRPTIIRDCVQAELSMGRWIAASKRLEVEASRYPDYSDLHLLMGQCLQAQGLMLEACAAYEAATNANASGAGTYISIKGANTYRPRTALAEIARLSGQSAKADRHILGALWAEPAYESAWRVWAEGLGDYGSSDEIRARLETVTPLVGKEDRITRIAARALAGAGIYDLALELLRTTNDSEPELACLCLVTLERYEEAIEFIREWPTYGKGRLSQATLEIGLLSYWSRGMQGPDWLFASLFVDEVERYRKLEAIIVLSEGANANGIREERLAELAMRLGDSAWKARLPKLAEQLARAAGCGDLHMAKSLYRQGYTLRCADRLLKMRQEELDAEGLFYLGEILFTKGHYSAAASLFEQALQRRSEYSEARYGAVECYLRMALKVADDGLGRVPHHPRLSQDRTKLDSSLHFMAGLRWRTA